MYSLNKAVCNVLSKLFSTLTLDKLTAGAVVAVGTVTSVFATVAI